MITLETRRPVEAKAVVSGSVLCDKTIQNLGVLGSIQFLVPSPLIFLRFPKNVHEDFGFELENVNFPSCYSIQFICPGIIGQGLCSD